MSKRLANNDAEMSEIREHLNRQDQTLKEILQVLKGSIAMGTDGMIQKFKQAELVIDKMCDDVAHLQKYKKTLEDSKILEDVYELRQWRKHVEETKGKITITPIEIFKSISAIIVFAGTLIGLLLALKQILEK